MSAFERIKSQKGEDHIFSNGFLYRPDKSGYRCIDCNTARGRIEMTTFITIGRHTGHKGDENKIIKKLIASKFTEITIKYSLSIHDLSSIYDKFKIKYPKYSQLVCSKNAIWLRARRNMEKMKLKKPKNKSKRFSESQDKKRSFEDLVTLVFDIENKYVESLKDNNCSAIDTDDSYSVSTVLTELPNESELHQVENQQNGEYNDLMAHLQPSFVDNRIDINRLESTQTNYVPQTKPFNIVIRDAQHNLIPFDVPMYQEDNVNYIIDHSDLITFTEMMKPKSYLNQIVNNISTNDYNYFLKEHLNIDCLNSVINLSAGNDNVNNNVSLGSISSTNFPNNNSPGKENLMHSVSLNEECLNEILKAIPFNNFPNQNYLLLNDNEVIDFRHSLSQSNDDDTILLMELVAPENI